MIERVRSGIEWLRDGAMASSEAESDRDGLLSTRREWHALVVGLAVGIVAGLTRRWELAGVAVAIVLGVRHAPGRLSQLRREPWYALGGLVLGIVATIGVMVLV
ncbi:hypothetical protein [Halapricum hydrolyticum]|uniref:Uncharacterized protein n=1 Tax=Halapricum hydrolyticum TaxID=2979991 RepID=A0AAE3LHS9_9EURY|nr:hypothetical protein [Halapricum hydrolyticum]MCU4716857.1 hypothetical protein [Halapricum hydrolyticum]MCU4725538.1 hypothetical protein [Halapricum hydrolyticum]